MQLPMKTDGRLSREHSLSIQYFIYYCIVGFFLPYFNLYCYHIGFSGFQIGLISAVRSVTLVVFALFWGSVADRLQVRHPVYIICAAVSTVLWLFFFWTRQFVPMLMVTILYGIFYSPLISFLEATTIEYLGERRRRYGRIRVWGSISFILTVVFGGRIIEHYSVAVVLEAVLAGSILLTFTAFGLPKTAAGKKNPLFSAHARFLLKPKVMVFLLCAVLMLVSHGAYYGFFSIHMERLGYGPLFIGLSWALAAGAEVFVMVKSEAIFRRFQLEHVLLFSLVVAAIRWGLLSFVTSPAAILSTQLLHAATYGSFHIASVLYMDHLAPGEAKTLGQAVNNALTYGLGLMIGFFLSGLLYEGHGGSVIFLFSGITAAASAVVFKLWGGKQQS